MKKLFFSFLLTLAGTVLFGQFNDPNAEVRKHSGFHGINVSSAFNVYLSQGNEEAVAVSAATTSDRALITTEVKDGILFIGYSKSGKWGSGNKKLKAYISVKQLNQITVSGACDVFIDGVLKADELVIKQSGASDMKGKFAVQKLKIDLSGASDMQISGTATRLYVEASGASDFKGFDLVTETCEAKASGASDIRITVNRELSAEASGASDVKYKGECRVREVKSSGSGSVSKGR